MRAHQHKAAESRKVRRVRTIACFVLATLLSLWTLGASHAAEHEAQHDTAPCGTCIAVASHGLVASATPALEPQPDTGAGPAHTHEDPAKPQQVLRLTARAPPSPLA